LDVGGDENVVYFCLFECEISAFAGFARGISSWGRVSLTRKLFWKYTVKVDEFKHFFKVFLLQITTLNAF